MGPVRAVLYIWAALAANAAVADPSLIASLRAGDMGKLAVHAEPVAAIAGAFQDVDGTPMTLADLEGRVTVVNFWATWCAPCREEMPTLSALQSALGGDDFRVVTIATGRNDPAAMARFFEEIGVTNLPLYRDPRQELARDMGVMGLPATIILDREGREVARLLGDADWNSDSARAIVQAIIGG